LRPFYPLKKDVLFRVTMLVGMQNVATIFKNPARNSGNDTWPIRPM
jgi:hypothetical protein